MDERDLGDLVDDQVVHADEEFSLCLRIKLGLCLRVERVVLLVDPALLVGAGPLVRLLGQVDGWIESRCNRSCSRSGTGCWSVGVHLESA